MRKSHQQSMNDFRKAILCFAFFCFLWLIGSSIVEAFSAETDATFHVIYISETGEREFVTISPQALEELGLGDGDEITSLDTLYEIIKINAQVAAGN